MKIETVRIDIVETEPVAMEWRPLRSMQEYPGSRKVRFTHRPYRGESVKLEPRPGYVAFLRLQTDENLETCGVLGVGLSRTQLGWDARTFKLQWEQELVGHDALNREYVWHKMWMARRYFHMPSTAPLALIDELLWDLAGLRAGLPVHKLLGGFRDRVPAYLTETAVPFEQALETAARARAEGFLGFKDHSILGVRRNVELARELRAAVGEGMALMHDAVQQYSVDEAIRVGRELEKLGYLWMEEPLQEFDIHGLRRLCDALDLPVLALESVQGAPYLATPYLVEGAVDIVRQTGLGITGQMKLANLCEMFGANCHGGNPHVVAAVRNDDWWEVPAWPPTTPDRALRAAAARMARDTHRVENGYMYPPQAPGLGRVIDWTAIAERTVEII